MGYRAGMTRWTRTLVVSSLVVMAGCPPEPTAGFLPATFPEGFGWGTAIAQWQAEGDEGEGGPVDSNWSRWAAMHKVKGEQTNPRGNGFHTEFQADIDRAAALGLTQFRLSLDWARVEPQPGVYDDAELTHFEAVLDAVRAAGMEPVLTLYHWTVPPWVQNPNADAAEGFVDRIADKDPAVVDDFEGFVREVIPRVKDRVDTYTVLNEPLTMVVVGYIDGRFPPGGVLAIERATDFGINLMRMHARAFGVIKELDDVDADGDGAASFVGLTMTANDVYPENPDSAQQQLAAESMNYVYNDWVLQTLTRGVLDVDLDGDVEPASATDPPEGDYPELANTLEFIGVQYYGPVKVKESALLNNVAPLFGMPLTDVALYTGDDDQARPHNAMGREISGAGFADTLDRYARWGLPLIVTENGTTTNLRPAFGDHDPPPIPAPVFDDAQAAMYLTVHLWEVARAIARGVDVRGYYHWTLADNFEWVEGSLQRFGAYRVDFGDPAMPRTLTTMGQAYGEIIAAGAVTEDLWGRYVLPRFPTDDTAAGLGATTSGPQVGALPTQ